MRERRKERGEIRQKTVGVTRSAERVEVAFWCSREKPEAAILERKRESGVPLFCVPRQRRSSEPENVSSRREKYTKF